MRRERRGNAHLPVFRWATIQFPGEVLHDMFEVLDGHHAVVVAV